MKQLIARVFAQNTNGAMSCAPERPISCDEATVESVEWMVPYVVDGKNLGYRRVLQTDKPSPDSVKTLRIRVGGQTYWLLIKDTDDASVFADACNHCCADGLQTIATDAIPDVIVEDDAYPDAAGNYTFVAQVPDVVAGQKITIDLSYNGGLRGDTAVPGAGFANAAALLTWLQANWAELGTFSLITGASGTTLVLTGTVVKSAGIFLDLNKADYNLDALVFPLTFDAVVSNGVTNTLVAPKTVQNISELILAIGNYLADGTLTATTATHLKYNGTGVPASLKLAGVVVKAFNAGA